jgi:hypothetical protein
MKFKKLKIVERRSLLNLRLVVLYLNLMMHLLRQRKKANIKILNKKIKKCRVSLILGGRLFKVKMKNLIYQQTHNKFLI